MLNSISTGTFQFGYPQALLFIIPAVLVLLLIIIKSFVAIDKKRLSDKRFISSRRHLRVFIFFSRVLIFTALFIALADPYGEVQKDVPGDLTVTMLVDNSSSMQIFDTSFVPTLKAELEKRLPVKLAYVS